MPAQGCRPCVGAPVTGLQVPTEPATSQAAHWPLHAESQHTPSTQKPEVHCAAPPQLSPAGRFMLHTPALHQWPLAQSASVVQVPAHALPPHTKGVHACVWGLGQWPCPSHAAASVATPLVQAGARHALAG